MLQYEENRRIYERSARLILLLALRDVCPGATLRVEHSIGQGVYMNVSGVSLTAALVRRIEAKMHEISARNLPIVKSRWTREQAIAYFDAQGQTDTVRLLRALPQPPRIIVVGAVVTEEYARRIGADAYAKDARAAVEAARRLLEKDE